MAKVTVYLTDDQFERLKTVKDSGRGGVSKLFQAFLETATGGSASQAGRYDYARSIMPTMAALEEHRNRLARRVQAGGPPADGGPVSIALTILLYRELLERDPDLAATIEKEFARFGLDELVADATDGVDLSAPPADTEADDDDAPGSEGFSWERNLGFPGGLGGPGALGGLENLGSIAGLGRIGDEVREALKHVGSLRENLRDLTAERDGTRSGRTRTTSRRTVVIEVDAGDDPRDLLTVRDFATFTSRHADWDAGTRLTPSQMETVRELLVRRAGGDPEADDDAPLPDDLDDLDGGMTDDVDVDPGDGEPRP